MNRRIIISDHTYEQLTSASESTGAEQTLVARDQIGEAYFGRFGNRETVEKTRNRIYWMASQLTGKRILDIGCSEGVLPILAGREGYEVIGIDLNAGAIEYAKNLLAKEPEDVRARVALYVRDLATFSGENGSFDTVLAGEVIEHLIAPRRFLEICASVMNEGSVLVLTTPFGISSNDDHKQTFFPHDLAKLLQGLFLVEHMSVTDGYIRINARKSESSKIYDLAKLLTITEDGAFAAQAATQSLLDERRRKLTQQIKKLKTTTDQLEALKKQSKTALQKTAAMKADRDAFEMKSKAEQREMNDIGDLATENYMRLNASLSKPTMRALKFKLSPLTVTPPTSGPLKLTKQGLRYGFPVEPGRDYKLSVSIEQQLPESRHEALVTFKYYDNGGAILKPPYPNTVQSGKIGAYRYINPNEIAERAWSIKYRPPEDASFLELTIIAWQPARRRRIHIKPKISIETTTIDSREKLSPLEKATNDAKKLANRIAKAQGRPGIASTSNNLADKKHTAPNLDSPSSSIDMAHQDSLPQIVIPAPNPAPSAPRFLTILDEFSETALKYDANLTRLSKKHWKQQINEGSNDALLVESAWRGNSEEWNYALSNPKSKNHELLKTVVNFARSKGLPTIFWNKEDPPNYDVFIESAKLFDHIFTTDIDCVDKYKLACGHDRIYAMPFFAQPKIHNPAGKMESKDRQVVFGGSWYAQKHQDRSHLAPLLFDAAADYNFTIYNRHSDQPNDGKYEFPDKYKPFLKPKISYEEMLTAHKSYQVFLNVNSVTNSETMFARRVFEVLACSTPVMSTASIGVEKHFGDLVPIVHTADESKTELNKLLTDDTYRRRIGHLGYRKVFSEHTARNRLAFLCEKAGLSYVKEKAPKVTWAASTNRPEHLNNIIRNYLRQDYPNMELIIALNSGAFDKQEVERQLANVPNAHVLQLSEDYYLGDCLNATIDAMTGDYWFKIDDDDMYFEKYTSDLMLTFSYAQARIVGKQSVYSYLQGEQATYQRFPHRQHRYVSFVSGATIAVDRRVFDKARFVQRKVGTDTQWMRDCLACGEKIYSADAYNFILVRREDKSSHTWQAEDNEVTRNAVKIADGLATDRIRI